jgi:hypothetical protein
MTNTLSRVFSRPLAGLGLVLALSAGLPLAGAETLLLQHPLTGFEKAIANGCDKSLVAAPDRGGQALHLAVVTKPTEGWMSHVFIYGLDSGIVTGDKVVVTFWVRTVSGGENGQGALKVELGQKEKPFTSVIAKFVMPTEQWTKHTIEGVAAFDLAADKARFGICAGYREQVVEIADIEVKNLGH